MDRKEFDCVLKKNCASYEECECDEIKCNFEEDCANCIHYDTDRDDQPCCSCVHGDCFEQIPMTDKKLTNYDRIRNMSVDELAEFILMIAIGYCSGQVPKNIKKWLESEVEGE